MSVKRVITAHCDAKGCHRFADLSPESTQPYRDLMEAGWLIDSESADEILTFCPDHRQETP